MPVFPRAVKYFSVINGKTRVPAEGQPSCLKTLPYLLRDKKMRREAAAAAVAVAADSSGYGFHSQPRR